MCPNTNRHSWMLHAQMLCKEAQQSDARRGAQLHLRISDAFLANA